MKLQKIMWHPRCNARAYEASGSRTTYEAKWNSQRVPNNNTAADEQGNPVCDVKPWLMARNQDMADNQNQENKRNQEALENEQDDFEGSD